MTDWTTRPARRADARGIATVFEIVQTMHREHRPDRFSSPTRDELLPLVEDWLADDATEVFVAVAAPPAGTTTTTVLGYALVARHHRPASALKPSAVTVELEHLAVAPEARAQGVATALCDEAVRWATAHGAERIELTTWAFNGPAQSLFASLGFTVEILRMSRLAPTAPVSQPAPSPD